MRIQFDKLVRGTLLAFLFFSYVNAFASLFPPSCVCKIAAKVLSVKEEIVPKDKHQTADLVLVDMEIEILGIIETVKLGMSEEVKCEDLYKTGMRARVRVIRERDFIDRNQNIKIGAEIQGNIECSGDERGAWFNFDKIELLKTYK